MKVEIELENEDCELLAKVFNKGEVEETEKPTVIKNAVVEIVLNTIAGIKIRFYEEKIKQELLEKKKKAGAVKKEAAA